MAETKGAAIKRRRKRLNLTQAEIAELAALSTDTVVRIENDRGKGRTSLRAVETVLESAERDPAWVAKQFDHLYLEAHPEIQELSPSDLARHTGTGSSQGSTEKTYAATSGVLTVNARAFAEIEALVARLVSLVISAKHIAVAGENRPDRQAPPVEHAAPRKSARSGR